MERGKELVKNTGILFFARISTQVVSFFLLPLFTSLLSTSQYGQLDIYSSLVMIVLPLTTLQLEQATFRFLVGKEDCATRTIVISTAIKSLTIIITIVSIMYFSINAVVRIEYGIPLFFYYFSMALSTVLYQVSRGFGQNTTYGIASFLISTITILLNVFFVAVFKMGVVGVVVSTSIAHFLGSCFMIYRTKAYRYVEWRRADNTLTIEMLMYSIPLIFNQISSWVINYSDRMIILCFLGISFNGIYSVSNKFSNILIAFFNVFNLAWTENVLKSIDDTDVLDYANRIISITITIYFIIITGIVNVLPFCFKFFVNAKFADSYYQIPILLAGAAFSGISACLGSIYLAFKKTKNVGITTIMAGITNIIVHLLLIHYIGLYAASISTLVAFMSLFAYRYINMQTFFKIRINWWLCLPAIGIFIISCAAYLIQKKMIIGITFVIMVVYLCVLMKKYRIEIVKLLKR